MLHTSMTCDHDQLIRAIQNVLTPADLRGKYKDRADSECSVEGHCALATEVLQALLWECGERQWKARYAVDKEEGLSHWWLIDPSTGEILDPTVEQFYYHEQEPPYHLGRGAGFQRTRWPVIDGEKVRMPSPTALDIISRIDLEPAVAITERFSKKRHARMDREDAAFFRENKLDWFKINVSEVDTPLGRAWYIHWFEVPREEEGLGRRYYELWESQLPPDVDLIYLDPAHNVAFWEAMGYEHLFRDVPGYEASYMIKYLHGGDDFEPFEYDSELEREFFPEYSRYVDYAPDLSKLREARVHREEAVRVEEDDDHWFDIEAYEQDTPFGPSWYIASYSLADHLQRERTGYGRRYYELWESQLPDDVDLIYLRANYDAIPFWKAMGYDFIFEDDEEGWNENWMIKSVKGRPLKRIPYDWDVEREFLGSKFSDEIDYVPDVSSLREGRVSREEAVILRETDQRWFEIEAYELPFGPQGPGWYIAWFTLPDLLAQKRTGTGRRYYELWESQLPDDVEWLYLHPTPKAEPFWEAMGYQEAFVGLHGLFVKNVKGRPVLPAQDDEELFDRIDYLTLHEEVNYAPDMSRLKEASVDEGLLYHTTSYGGLLSIIESHEVRPKNYDGFVSFSEYPFRGDIEANDVTLVFRQSALAPQLEKVEYNPVWFNEHREQAAYVAGEGWREQFTIPEECFEYDEETDWEEEDEECVEEAYWNAEWFAFEDKFGEEEWISREQGTPVVFSPEDIVRITVHDPEYVERVQEALKEFNVRTSNKKRNKKRRPKGWGETVNTFLVQTCGRNSILPECEGAEGFSVLPTGKMPKTKKANPEWWGSAEEDFQVDPLSTITVRDILEVFDEMIDLQCSNGNWNYDPYMHGMANGMIFMRSLVGAGRPEYLEAPDVWLADLPDDGLPPETADGSEEGSRPCGRNLYYPMTDEERAALTRREGRSREWVNRDSPYRRRRRSDAPFLKERKNPKPPGTTVDTIVETCGRNYHPEECRDYEKGFRWAMAELQPFVILAADPVRDREFRAEASRMFTMVKDALRNRGIQYQLIASGPAVIMPMALLGEEEYDDVAVAFAPVQRGAEGSMSVLEGAPWRFGVQLDVLPPSFYKLSSQHALEALPYYMNKSTWMHEFIHVLDAKRMDEEFIGRKRNMPGSMAEYINSPQEFNAFYQERAAELEEWLGKMFPEALEEALSSFDTFLDTAFELIEMGTPSFYKHIDEKYLRKLKQRLYQFYVDYKEQHNG